MSEKDTTHTDLEEMLKQFSAEEHAELRRLWDASARADNVPQPDPGRMTIMWNTLEKAAAEGTVRPDRPPARIHRLRRWRTFALPIAATILVAAVGLFWWFRPVVTEVEMGQTMAVMLPDGSRIELNSGSKIRHSRSFGDVRQVELEGEAFFDVVESDIPFRVSTFNADVEVLGTTFNVKAWPAGSGNATIVTLASGSVQFAAKREGGASVTMTPGETRSITGEDQVLDALDTRYETQAYAWRAGDFVFIEEELQVVVEDIERRFGVQIAPLPPEISRRSVVIALRSPLEARDVIEAICYSLGLNFRPTMNGYEIISS